MDENNKTIQAIERSINAFIRQSEVADAQTRKDIEYISREIKELKDLISQQYVTRQEFDPVKKVVYGLVSVILLTVIGALMALVIKQ